MSASVDAAGRLSIRGRKKEMIVTPDGLNVFPEDVEGVLNKTPGVRESAVVGVTHDGRERVHAVLALDDGADRTGSCPQGKRATRRSSTRSWILGLAFRRTPADRGYTKTQTPRASILGDGNRRPREIRFGDEVEAVIAQYAPGRSITAGTTIEELGLSSLERVELLMALERRFGMTIDEGAYADAKRVSDLKRIVSEPVASGPAMPVPAEPVDFPGMESLEMGLCGPARESAALDSAAGTDFLLDAGRRS